MIKAARWVTVVLGFLWMAFVYASFYLVQQQRPFGTEVLRAVGSLLLELAVAGAILFAAASAGHQICRRLGVLGEGAFDALIWSTGTGLGVFALGMFVLGLLGLLRSWVIWVWLVAMVALSLPDAVAVVRALRRSEDVRRPGRALRVYLVGMFLITALLALAPPLGWDSLFYHLTLPKLYLAQGQIGPVTDVPHQYFPGLMEMLYLGAMTMAGDVAAKLLHLAFLPLSAGMVYLLAQRHLGKRHGWPAVVAYASMPMVWLLGSWAYNDLALAFYQLAALVAFLNWRERNAGRWLALSGALSGLALGCKYTALICPVALVTFILWTRLRARARLGRLLGDLATYGLVALAMAMPWYARNVAFTGNPVYPFAYGAFGGRGWDPWRAAWYARTGSGLGWDPGALLKLPWTATLGLRDMNFYDGRAGPLFLLALPLLLAWVVHLYRTPGLRPVAMGYMLAFAGLQYGTWTYGVVVSRSLFQSRLLLPALGALCAPMAYVYDELSALDLRVLSLRRVVGLTVTLVLAANLCYHALYAVRVQPLPVLVGIETRDAFLERNLGAHYAAMAMVNERVPAHGSVLFLWEPRSYYCERRSQPDAVLGRWAWLRHQHGDIGEIARALATDGYTHVLLHRAGLELVVQAKLDPLVEADLSALEQFIGAFLVREDTVPGAYELYRSARGGL
jgi:hypothetical protein